MEHFTTVDILPKRSWTRCIRVSKRKRFELIGNLRSPVKFTTHYGQFSQELRLASPSRASSGLPLQWVSRSLLRRSMDSQQELSTNSGINTAFPTDLRFFHRAISGERHLQSATERGDLSFSQTTSMSLTIRTYDERQYASSGRSNTTSCYTACRC